VGAISRCLAPIRSRYAFSPDFCQQQTQIYPTSHAFIYYLVLDKVPSKFTTITILHPAPRMMETDIEITTNISVLRTDPTSKEGGACQTSTQVEDLEFTNKDNKTTPTIEITPTPHQDAENNHDRIKNPIQRTASPIRRAASPIRRAASPIRRAASPIRRVGSPLRRVVSPIQRAVGSSARRFPVSKQPLGNSKNMGSNLTPVDIIESPHRYPFRSSPHGEASHLNANPKKDQGHLAPTFCRWKYEDHKHRMMLDFLNGK